MRIMNPKMRFFPYALQYALLPFFAGCAGTAASQSAIPSGVAAARSEVRPGIEVLATGDASVLRGMRVGLVTNHTGKTRTGESTIDVLHRDQRFRLVALFAPEHGIRGALEGGVTIETERDSKTGLPIHSLYGAATGARPTPEMLKDLDAIVFDIQEIGSRFYTYQWTLTQVMQAAAEHGKRVVVLDRPTPIGGELVQGNVNDTLSFVGLWPFPMRHGMTVGEVARYVNREHNINADLIVIPMAGWTRNMYFEQTGLPWTPPSPNMPSIESAIHYAGLCIFEGTNLAPGRGTPIAFQIIGAPWLDARKLIERLNTYKFPGVRFEAITTTPNKPGDNKYNGQLINAVRFITTDRRTYDPPKAALAALLEVRKQHPAEFKWTGTFQRLYGLRGARDQIEGGATYEELIAPWEAQIASFKARRQKHLLYGDKPQSSLESAVRERIAQLDSGEVAVSFIDLGNNKELHINGDAAFHAASTMKVPVLLEAFRRHDEDPLFALDDMIVVNNRFKSIAEDSYYSLNASDDSDSAAYNLVGQRAPIRDLVRRMITRSSNLATNVVIDLLSAEEVRKTVARVGGEGMNVLRGVEDGPAFRKGMNNTTTSRGFAKVLEAIGRCKIVTRTSCDAMIEILSAQEFNEMIPAGLPPGTKVAHKTGWITRVQHDGGIVYPQTGAPYVLVVLTKGISDTKVVDRFAADISRIVFERRYGEALQ